MTFTDAAFAFAVTLLVISIDAVPSSQDELVRALEGIPAFGLSFALLAMFWHGHWQWSWRFGLEDGSSVLLGLTLVFVILTYVYPTKYLATPFMAWVSPAPPDRSGCSCDGPSLEPVRRRRPSRR